LTCLPEVEADEDVRKWESDYLELMDYIKNPNYGKLIDISREQDND
jgi:hypothetical protein